MTTTAEAPERLLDRVRKLLAKAEAEGVTAAEAQALTAKAAELMAKYGIDRALLAARQPDTDKPDNRIVEIYNPWARVQAHLLCGLAAALRCQCILLPSRAGQRVHMFGYASDLERTDVLYTSVLIQMWHGLVATEVPADVEALGGLQRGLLTSALDAARPGGVVAYVTCSPHPAETGDIVAAVLAGRDDVTVLDAPAVLSEVPDLACGPDGRYAQFWPHRHGTDAIFLALLRVSP